MLFEFVAGSHAELSEDLAQVVVDGAGADEQLGSDLRVGGTFGGQTRDLRFLGGQVVSGFGCPFAGVLPGRLELNPGALRIRLHPELAEERVGFTQLLTRVEPAALTP